jgi:hypothetical protein
MRGLTQRQLGELLEPWIGKWAKQQISAAELGRRSFAAEELVALSACLEQPLGFFFHGNGEAELVFSGGQTVSTQDLPAIIHRGEVAGTIVELEALARAGELAKDALESVQAITHLAEARLRASSSLSAEGEVYRGAPKRTTTKSGPKRKGGTSAKKV